MQIFHQLFKEITVFGLVNGRQFCPQQFNTKLFKNPCFRQFHGHVETRLTTQGWQESIWAFLPKNTRHKLKRNWFNVNLVCDFLISHDGRRVGVDKNHTVALLFQGQAGLRTRIIKLSSLTNNNRTRPNHHNFFNIRTFRHNV